MIELKRENGVALVAMRSGENRFNPGFIAELSRSLDEVENSDEPHALVLTGDGKFFSNGLDLAWMSGEGRDRAGEVVRGMLGIFARLLSSPVPSVAALNGHAFAGGAMLALACDFRVMRSDRGFFCIPEIDLGLPLHPGMASLIQARLPKLTAHEAIITGKRYGGIEALEKGITDYTVPAVDLVTKSLALAAPLAGKNRAVMQAHKRLLYAETLRLLTEL
ncbi:MAG TPA: enoyl-CoA hydratase/isomerase family protein [Myxococcota bacterium]|nr:enoyl-CoA hydratase/isomerase family protein [Myxococcota bacterium]